jgi:hypothetical protein
MKQAGGMKPPVKQNEKVSFKQIVQDQDNWAQYQQVYADQVSADQIAEVEKMLGCGDPSQGFSTYICLNCGEQLSVPFSCKSRVCSSCGKAHADAWSGELVGRLWNVSHRHVTFTVPAELWVYFEQHVESRSLLYEAANATLRQIIRGEPGMVMVLHPYGKDLKVNFHLHVLVTEGGLDDQSQFHEQGYLSYAGLRKIWQYELLTRLRTSGAAEPGVKALIKTLFERYPQGFYVHAEPKVKQTEGLSRYIGRYSRHPAIADSRIVAYDGQTVTFFYEQRLGQGQKQKIFQRLPVLEFIHGVVRHIPPKQFKMVRYYGLYAPCKAKKLREKMGRLAQALGRAIYRLGWRQRIRRDFKRDPLRCPRCGQAEMELFSLTIRCGHRLITFGGLKWLLARGSIIDSQDPDPPPVQVPPQPLQLAFAFLRSP